jgi:hypothetical protein
MGRVERLTFSRSLFGRSEKGAASQWAWGAGLFYGDAMITPAISVLSSVKSLMIVTPALGTYVVPITVSSPRPLGQCATVSPSRMTPENGQGAAFRETPRLAGMIGGAG